MRAIRPGGAGGVDAHAGAAGCVKEMPRYVGAGRKPPAMGVNGAAPSFATLATMKKPVPPRNRLGSQCYVIFVITKYILYKITAVVALQTKRLVGLKPADCRKVMLRTA
jgi:hypothetical protein